MLRTVALLLSVALLAGCGVGDRDGSGIPQAGDGGCEESHRDGAQAWQPAALVQDGDSWQPPAQPHDVGDEFAVGDWTVKVDELDYNATEQVEAALAEQGLTYDGTPIEDWTWVVAEVALTYGGAGSASGDAELESRYVDREGNLYADFQCGLDNPEGNLSPGQTATVSFGVPVPPGQVGDGFWGIGPADDPGIADLAFVR